MMLMFINDAKPANLQPEAQPSVVLPGLSQQEHGFLPLRVLP
jgi:hypothetical protein